MPTLTTLYVVFVATGCYEDTNEHIMEAHVSKDAAEAHIECLKAQVTRMYSQLTTIDSILDKEWEKSHPRPQNPHKEDEEDFDTPEYETWSQENDKWVEARAQEQKRLEALVGVDRTFYDHCGDEGDVRYYIQEVPLKGHVIPSDPCTGRVCVWGCGRREG